ncbi:MAG: SDR family NAD(P)-dependent oxidoreductase, partial [Planctomycetales bacterium]|nr:SDR family NAD(P)-dependent oxidoreductase [Planctomycetales bacterium]
QRVTYQSVSPESFRRLSPNDSESTLFAEHWEQLPKELSAPDEPQRVLVLGDGKTVAGISEALDELGCQSEMLPIASLPSCTPDQSTIVMVGKGLNTDGIVSAEGAIESIYAPLLQLLSNSNQSIERLVYLESVDDPLDDFGTLARSSLHGFLRVVEMEYPGIQCRTIRINEDSSPQRVAQEVLRPENETLVIVDRDQSQAMRLLPLPTDPGPVGVFHLPKSTDGSISGLQFKSTSRRAPRAGEVEIRVATAGMNFRDVLNVLRRYPGEAGPPGCECAGEIVSVGSQHSRFQIGDSVFALVAGSFASHVTVREEFVVHRPSKLDQQVAAGIPLAWVTAKLALETRANIKCGDKILIHQASGGVGCAAIAIAKDVGADIWGTAGTESKRQFLSQLGGVNVLDSRTPDFSEAILRKTNGRGLDVVVNSLSGALARENLKVVATGGWYVELGKIDVPSEAEFLALRPDVKYSRLSVDELLSTAPQLIQACLEDLADSFASERFWLGPCKSYNVSEIQAAFRRLSEDDHVGKVVVAGFGNSHPPPRTPIRSDRSYLITGALGSIGREVSRWLVDRGAKTLILVSRNPDRGHGPAFVDELRSQGVQVRVCQGDVANKSVVASAIAPSIEGDMDPLAGVFHLAAVVNDSSIRTMSVAQLEEVMRPKLLGAHHLDLLTRDLEIEVFCLFSSIAAPFGSPTQAAYAAANAGLDALARRRRALGYPALSVQWSPWEDKSGMASGAANNMKRIWRRFGLTPLTFTKGRSILDALLNTSEAVVTVLPIDWESFSGGLGDNPTPAILKRFVQTSNKLRGDRGSLLETIRTTPRSLRESLVVERLSAEAGNLIGGTVRQDQSFAELGFDSILGIEFANRLGTILAHSFSPTRLYEYPTIAQLAKSILSSFDSEFEQHPVGQKSKKASHRFRSATDLLADIESDADSSAMKSNDERGATQ